MERICTSFNVSLYPCPAYELERQPLLNEVETKLTELRTVLDKSASRQANILRDIYLYGSYWKGLNYNFFTILLFIVLILLFRLHNKRKIYFSLYEFI